MSETYYSARELAGMKLPCFPTTERNVLRKATLEHWPSRKRPGRGGGYEYAVAGLPTAAQEEIKRRAVKNVLALAPTTTTIALRSGSAVAEANATGRQRLIADARRGVIAAIDAVIARTGYSRMHAAQALIDMARLGEVSEQVVRQLELARDGRGRASPDGLPSVRSLLRFIERAESGTLVPAVSQRDMSVPAWAPLFMEYYQRPEKPSVQHAYERFAIEWTQTPTDEPQRMLPSIHKVRHFLKKVGHVSREVGRMGPRELKALKPFKRRHFADLLPCAIYSADGHTFDAEVQHPKHGRPFRPEITSVIDIATRKLVGWSTALSESSLAVLSAIRNAVETNGVPAQFYVDNGSGYCNAMMQDEATGFMGRLGVTMVHSLPYNSQERGVIERLHRTVWVKAAKELPGYMGDDMDRQARQKMHKITRNAIKLREAGQTAAMPLLAWEDFVAFCAAKVQAYNDRPHRSLPKITVPGGSRHMTPNEMWAQKCAEGFEPHMLTEVERALIWRPQEMRAVQRCEISLHKNRYFSPALEEWHGAQLRVAYDIHDASRVWIYDDDERFICVAELNGNQTDYSPKSFVERADEKRAIGRAKRHEAHLEEIDRELHGRTPIEYHDAVTIPGIGTINLKEPLPIESKPEPVAEEWAPPSGASKARERYEEWKRLSAIAPEDLPNDRARRWVKSYPEHHEWIGFQAVEKLSA